MNQEDRDTIAAMETYGGGFIKAIAGAFRRADSRNFYRLQVAFSDEWIHYARTAKKLKTPK